MLQKSADTVNVKDFKKARTISDPSFLSTFPRLLTNWKQLLG